MFLFYESEFSMYKIMFVLSLFMHAASAADLSLRLQQGLKGTTFTLENMVLSLDQMPALQNFFMNSPQIDTITIAVTEAALQPTLSYNITPGSFPDIISKQLPDLKDITFNGIDFSRFSVPPLMRALASKGYLRSIKFPHVRQRTLLSQLPLMNGFYPSFIQDESIEVCIGNGDLLVTHAPEDVDPNAMLSEKFLFSDEKVFCTDLFLLHTICLDECCYSKIATFFKVNHQIESVSIGIKPGQLDKFTAILEAAMLEYKPNLRKLRIEGKGFSEKEVENLVNVITDKSTISIIQMDGVRGHYTPLFDKTIKGNPYMQRASFGGFNIEKMNGLGIVYQGGWHL